MKYNLIPAEAGQYYITHINYIEFLKSLLTDEITFKIRKLRNICDIKIKPALRHIHGLSEDDIIDEINKFKEKYPEEFI